MPLQTVQARGQITLTRDVRHGAGIAPGDLVLTRVTGPGTVEVHVVRPLPLAELLGRYRIEGPVEEAADREAWQADATREVLGSADG